jgi:hypothetical protein
MQRAVNKTIDEEVFSMWFTYIHCWATDMFSMGPSQDYISGTEPNQIKKKTRVEAGSNTSTVTLRVVGGDEKRSLKYETVKYGHESYGTRTRKWLPWQGPAAIVNDRPVLSSERAPKNNKPATVSNKDLVVSPRWVLHPRQTGRLTVGRNVRLRLRSNQNENENEAVIYCELL